MPNYEYICVECERPETSKMAVEDRDRLAPVCCGKKMRRKLSRFTFSIR